MIKHVIKIDEVEEGFLNLIFPTYIRLPFAVGYNNKPKVIVKLRKPRDIYQNAKTIIISDNGYKYNFSKKEDLINFAKEEFEIPANYIQKNILDIESNIEIANAIAIYKFLPKSIIKISDVEESNIFQLFASLGSSSNDVYKAYNKIELPKMITLTSLMTMFSKTVNQELVKGGYKRVLKRNAHLFPKFRNLVLKTATIYRKIPDHEIDFIILSLSNNF